MSNPYDRPSDPAKRHSAALTDGVDRAAARAMLKGTGLRRRRPCPPARRCCDVVDRDDAVQPQPAQARCGRQAWHPRGRRHADGVQHDRGVGRRLDGQRRNARLTRLARGDRGLDRAGRARPPLRRARLPGRLRQDHPLGRDGPGASRPAGARALQRLDRAGPLPRTRRDDPRRVRSGGRACSGHDERGGRARARGCCVPGRRRVRRTVHGQHDVACTRVPWHQPRGTERDSRARPCEGRSGTTGRQACARSRAR